MENEESWSRDRVYMGNERSVINIECRVLSLETKPVSVRQRQCIDTSSKRRIQVIV